MLLLLVACAGTLLTAPAAGGDTDDGEGTCDFRLVEENRLSAWSEELREIGVRGDNSLCIAGLAMTNWHNPNATFDLDRFCTVTREELLVFVHSKVLPVLNNDTEWRGLLTMDLENEVRPDLFHAFDDTKLAAVVEAMKLRVSVLREVLPHAGVSMYAVPSPFENLTGLPQSDRLINTSTRFEIAAQGYQRASRLGLFDEMAYTSPSLYMGPNWNHREITTAVLKLSESVTTSAGKPLPLAPYLSWVYFGGAKAVGLRCEVPAEVMAEQVKILMGQPKERVPIVQWWLGQDSWPSCPQSCVEQGFCTTNETQLAYMQRGAFVPKRCL
eukprot:COSAG02_NODE_7170_length_3138_cov_113.769231_1_plen_327_part_00